MIYEVRPNKKQKSSSSKKATGEAMEVISAASDKS